jgi:hypothetical protein
MAPASTLSVSSYQVRFQPLQAAARAYAFRCDSRGNVELDALGERARANYFFARALVGRDYARPAVVAVDLQ